MLFLLELLYTYFIFYLKHLFQHTYFTGLVLWHNRVLVHASGNANENGASHWEPVTHVGDTEEAPGSDKPSHGSWGHSSRRKIFLCDSVRVLPSFTHVFPRLITCLLQSQFMSHLLWELFSQLYRACPCIHTHTHTHLSIKFISFVTRHPTYKKKTNLWHLSVSILQLTHSTTLLSVLTHRKHFKE